MQLLAPIVAGLMITIGMMMLSGGLLQSLVIVAAVCITMRIIATPLAQGRARKQAPGS